MVGRLFFDSLVEVQITTGVVFQELYTAFGFFAPFYSHHLHDFAVLEKLIKY